MKEEEIIFNVITVGDSGVGKSSIIKRYTYNIFEEETLSTIGLSYAFKEVEVENGKKVKIKLIDTGGQEKYRALCKSYFRNANAVLFVFSMNNENTLKNINDWIETFKNYSNENIVKYLIGNKVDLGEEVDMNLINQISKDNNLKFKSISSKENISIDELFQEICNDLYQNYKKSNKKENLKIEKHKHGKKRKKKC